MIDMIVNEKSEEKIIIINKEFLEENYYDDIAKYLIVGTVFDYRYLVEKTEDERYFFDSTETIYRGFIFKIEDNKYGVPNGKFYTTEQNNNNSFDLKEQLLFAEQGYCEITIKLVGLKVEK